MVGSYLFSKDFESKLLTIDVFAASGVPSNAILILTSSGKDNFFAASYVLLRLIEEKFLFGIILFIFPTRVDSIWQILDINIKL